MTDFKRNLAYQSSMMQVRLLQEQGILSREDLVLIESKLSEKYGLKIGSLEREIDLINLVFRANMGEKRK